ncbi:hypothetical protein L1987_62306 [Smallanthus sonchifolius]|uniref:Uncharacterized protein n=1 Tax=Smallanthus sonchifolius TaxID=185202 RepID=A0ACB9CA18_9ASTR|nr:hypothetical protein L1987_62306 [Smallanthus sonchifolius]
MATLQEPQIDLEAGGGHDTRRLSVSFDGSERSITATTGVVVEKGRASSVSDLSVVDLGGEGSKVDLLKVEKDCRICQLSLDVNIEESGNGIPIELGCCCKHDLAAAHKHCAEAWFKIKGNRTCEICGSIARNIGGADETEPIDQWNGPNGSTPSRATTVPGETMATLETRSFWQGHRFLNFLLASMVFAFVISWLFHFNIPS